MDQATVMISYNEFMDGNTIYEGKKVVLPTSNTSGNSGCTVEPSTSTYSRQVGINSTGKIRTPSINNARKRVGSNIIGRNRPVLQKKDEIPTSSTGLYIVYEYLYHYLEYK